MPELVYDRICFTSLDDACERMKAFAKAHVDFEPTLACERVQGRRRWVLSVSRRMSVTERGDDE